MPKLHTEESYSAIREVRKHIPRQFLRDVVAVYHWIVVCKQCVMQVEFRNRAFISFYMGGNDVDYDRIVALP